MDKDLLEWITGMIIGNIVAWSVLLGMVRMLLNRAKHTEAKTDKMLLIHENEEYGIRRVLEEMKDTKKEQAQTNRELIYYMKWFVKQMSGKNPEPFVDSDH